MAFPKVSLFLLIVALCETAAFVPAAVRLSCAQSQQQPIATSSIDTQLWASKKKKTATPTKFQVKMLKHVAGTGQAGEVINVTPAFFNNKLRPTGAAVVISDDEVEKEASEVAAANKARMDAAKELQGQLKDYTMELKRKSGPDGKLFAGIGPKILIDELNAAKPSFLWKEKGVKLAEVQDENGKKMRGDIKVVGSFSATVNLAPSVTGKFAIEVTAM